MNRDDFKVITDTHFSLCEAIIEREGRCTGPNGFPFACGKCPFVYSNATDGKECCEDNKYVRSSRMEERSEVLLNNARKFIKKFGGRDE